MTVTNPTAGGFLTVWSGGALPTVSNLNFVTGQTVANLVVAAVSSAGTVTYSVNGAAVGSVDVLADVTAGSRPAPRRPTARSVPCHPPGCSTPAGRGASPPPRPGRWRSGASAGCRRADAVVLDVAVTNPGAAGYLTAFPGGTPRTPAA